MRKKHLALLILVIAGISLVAYRWAWVTNFGSAGAAPLAPQDVETSQPQQDMAQNAAPPRKHPVLTNLPRGQNVPVGGVMYEPGSPAAVRFTQNLFGEAAALVEVLFISSGYNSEGEDPMINFTIVARVKEGDGAKFAEKLKGIWSRKDYFAWNKDDFIHQFADNDVGTQERESEVRMPNDISWRANRDMLDNFSPKYAPLLANHPKLLRLMRGERLDSCILHYALAVPEVILLHSSIPRATADWKFPELRAADGSIPPHAVRKK